MAPHAARQPTCTRVKATPDYVTFSMSRTNDFGEYNHRVQVEHNQGSITAHQCKIKILRATTKIERNFESCDWVTLLKFPADSHYLFTNLCPINLKGPPAGKKDVDWDPFPYLYANYEGWICYGRKRFLRVPPGIDPATVVCV